jgi:hypothetical protein
VTVVRIEALESSGVGAGRRGWLLLLALLSACSSRLELGHDLPSGAGTASKVGEPTSAICNGAPCFRGPVLEVASSKGDAKSIALDDENVYWAAPAAQTLMITPRDGGTTSEVQVPTGGPFRVVADPGYVFFSGNGGGYIAALSKATHAITVMVTHEQAPQSLVIGNAIYFSDPSAGTVKRAGYDGTPADQVSAGQAIETLATGISGGGELAIDADWLYYSDNGRGEINAIDRLTDAVVRLSENLASPGALLPRGDSLYFLELGTPEAGYADGRLMRMPRGGGDTEVLVPDLDAPTALAADETSLYIAMRGNQANGFRGRIVRFADDGQVATLATDQAEAISIAVDDRTVFWTVDSDSENALRALQR